VLPRDTGRDTRIICWAGRALRGPRRCRGRALGAAGQAQPVYFADHRVSRHVAEFGCDLLAERPLSQSFFSCSTRSSDQVNTVIAIFPSRHAGPNAGSAGDAKSQISLQQNPLVLAGREKRARTFTPNIRYRIDQNRRTRCRTRQQNATIWRDSGARVRAIDVHMFRHLCIADAESCG